MKKILIIIVILLLPSIADAQRWKQYRRQFIFGAGVTNFLGDLGGANDIGRDGLVDLEIVSTRPSLMVGYRYQLNKFIFLRSNLQWGILHGDDKNTLEQFRQERNIKFRSAFGEINAMAEFYFLQNSRNNLYRLRGVRGRNGLKVDLYLFTGIGFMFFNPKTEYQGQWVALQPIGTEGQGLPGAPEKYKRHTFTIPYGIGVGKSIDRFWSFNVELTFRATFTDYIDDVSGNYYGRDALYNESIENGMSESDARQRAILSDPNLTFLAERKGNNDFSTNDLGQYNERNIELGNEAGINIRGDASDNDSFMTGMFTLSYKIVKRRRSRPKF